jgi:pyrroline-5-carboxylate reductase
MYTGTSARLIIMAVKPYASCKVLESMELRTSDIVVSVAAGVTLGQLREVAPNVEAVVRAMPNTPALVGAGVTGLLGEDRSSEQIVGALFEAVGEVVYLRDESQFDGLTAVSGSGPAYMFLILEALADAGVEAGLDREMAQRLARATMAGAAALAGEPGVHPAQLKDRVASPNGTTIAGLAALEEHGLRRAVWAAVRAATARSRQLSGG